MDFFMTVVAERVDRDSALRKVGALIDWQRLAAILGPVRSRLRRALRCRLDDPGSPLRSVAFAVGPGVRAGADGASRLHAVSRLVGDQAKSRTHDDLPVPPAVCAARS